MFMGRDLNLFRINIKRKLLNRISSLLLCLKLHCASHFIIVLDLYLLYNPFWILGRD